MKSESLSENNAYAYVFWRAFFWPHWSIAPYLVRAPRKIEADMQRIVNLERRIPIRVHSKIANNDIVYLCCTSVVNSILEMVLAGALRIEPCIKGYKYNHSEGDFYLNRVD